MSPFAPQQQLATPNQSTDAAPSTEARAEAVEWMENGGNEETAMEDDDDLGFPTCNWCLGRKADDGYATCSEECDRQLNAGLVEDVIFDAWRDEEEAA